MVSIYNLNPESAYHYQIRSKAKIGPIAKSRDFIFRTKSEVLEITNQVFFPVSTEEAAFQWTTNIETDTTLKYIPYRGSQLQTDQAKTIYDKAMTKLHEVTLKGLEAGAAYDITISGKDSKGRIVSKQISAFTTTKDNLPPIIAQVQTDSAISPGKTPTIQTIISWITNEPTIGRVIYNKGIITNEEDLKETTNQETNYTKQHTAVITKFEAGTVYTFKVIAEDSNSNKTISKTFTILTPRQKESVFQVIMKNLEKTFGWVGKMN
ncbi:MAG: hypothetical protein V1698_01710 [bacterium]